MMKPKKKIAVIDDEKDLCTLIKDILEGTGKFQVVSAHSGDKGKELCIREKPDLIFLDFVMPKVRGDDVAKYLKKNSETKDIPIVVISGLGELACIEDEAQWREFINMPSVKENGEVPKKFEMEGIVSQFISKLGAEAFLPKPFSKEQLLNIVENILVKH